MQMFSKIALDICRVSTRTTLIQFILSLSITGQVLLRFDVRHVGILVVGVEMTRITIELKLHLCIQIDSNVSV